VVWLRETIVYRILVITSSSSAESYPRVAQLLYSNLKTQMLATAHSYSNLRASRLSVFQWTLFITRTRMLFYLILRLR